MRSKYSELLLLKNEKSVNFYCTIFLVLLMTFSKFVKKNNVSHFISLIQQHIAF